MFGEQMGRFSENSLEGRMEQEPKEKIQTKVILELMRHSKKETDPSKTDEEILLTGEGRALATERGRELQPQPEVSMAYGSPKKRTQETAARAMLVESIDDPDADLEAIEEMVRDHLKYGEKIREDERLSFDLSGPMGQEMLTAFKAGEYLPYLIRKSDQRAIETKDTVSTTYLRQAENVAELVKRYAQVGNNFQKLAERTDKYEQFGNQLERYMGTHQGVAECFVAKVLEKIQGNAERDAFIESIGTGFGETRGIHIEIVNTGDEQKIVMMYPVKNKEGIEEQQSVEFSAKLLDEIIEERKEFELMFVADNQ